MVIYATVAVTPISTIVMSFELWNFSQKYASVYLLCIS